MYTHKSSHQGGKHRRNYRWEKILGNPGFGHGNPCAWDVGGEMVEKTDGYVSNQPKKRIRNVCLPHDPSIL